MELLAMLATQSAASIRGARLTEVLAAQLQRLVLAEEAERRRIERDLHDGIQQQLVALMAGIQLARTLVDIAPARAVQALEELRDLATRTNADLRRFVRGIHPPVLTDRGIVAAIEARLAEIPLGVAVCATEAVRETRFSPEVEGAAYFLVCEGLANVMKHAGVDAAVIELSLEAGELKVEIRDEGRGFGPGAVGDGGLRGLADRLEALGGRLEVVGRVGSGTSLVERLPAPEAAGV